MKSFTKNATPSNNHGRANVIHRLGFFSIFVSFRYRSEASELLNRPTKNMSPTDWWNVTAGKVEKTGRTNQENSLKKTNPQAKDEYSKAPPTRRTNVTSAENKENIVFIFIVLVA